MSIETISVLTDEELKQIQEEYKNRKLKENLCGPVISTLAHIILLIVCAFCISSAASESKSEIAITQSIQEPPIKIPPPPPPPVENIEPPEVPESEVTNIAMVDTNNVDTPDNALEKNELPDNPSTNDNADNNIVSDIKNILSPSVSSNFGGRANAGKGGFKNSSNTSTKAQDKVNVSMDWLSKVQNPDGSWGNASQDAFTSLALLCYLGRGETPQSTKYGKTVSKAIQYLMESNGRNCDTHEYSYPLKLYALSEAYAMTGNYSIEPVCVKLLDRVISGQCADGSFDYNLNSSSTRKDLSYGCWNIQAIKAAKVAGVPHEKLDECISKLEKYLFTSASQNFPYSSDRQGTDATKAGGMLCLQLYNIAWENGKIKPELESIEKNIFEKGLTTLDWNKPPHDSLYTWYYQTYSIFQSQKNFKVWQRKFEPMLIANMHKEGYWKYPGAYHGSNIGDELTQKIHATVFSILLLEVSYRFLPSTKLNEQKTVDKKQDEIINL